MCVFCDSGLEQVRNTINPQDKQQNYLLTMKFYHRKKDRHFLQSIEYKVCGSGTVYGKWDQNLQSKYFYFCIISFTTVGEREIKKKKTQIDTTSFDFFGGRQNRYNWFFLFFR